MTTHQIGQTCEIQSDSQEMTVMVSYQQNYSPVELLMVLLLVKLRGGNTNSTVNFMLHHGHLLDRSLAFTTF